MNKNSVVMSVLMILVVIPLALSAHTTMFGFQMYVTNSTGSPVESGNITLNVSGTNSCDGALYTKVYTDNLTTEGILDVMIGEDPTISMDYNSDYYICIFIENVTSDWEQVGDPFVFRGGQGQIGLEDVSFTPGDNESWNESYADTLYANIQWGYNMTTAAYNLWNDIWSSTFNQTYADWNKTYADTLYSPIGSANNPFDQSLNTTDKVVFTNLNVTGVSWFDGALMPITTLLHDIGSGSNRWRVGYFQNISADYADFLYDVSIGGDLNVENVNATSMNVTNITIKNMWIVNTIASGNITADYFFGNGSQLTDLPSGNPFDQSLNTTDNVTHDYVNVTNELIVGIDSGFPIKIEGGRISLDAGTVPWDDVYISSASNILSFFARADVNKDKYVQLVASPTTGYLFTMGNSVNIKQVASETQDVALGKDSIPWGIVYSKNLSNGTTTVDMDTVLKYSYNMSDGNDLDGNASSICAGDTTYLSGEGNCNDLDSIYALLGYNPFDQSLNTTDTVTFAGVNMSENTGLATVQNVETDISSAVIIGGKPWIDWDYKISSGTYVDDGSAFVYRFLDTAAGNVVNSIPWRGIFSNIRDTGLWITVNSTRNVNIYGGYVEAQSYDDDKTVWGFFTEAKGNGTTRGYQGSGQTTATNGDEAVGVYGYSSAPTGGTSPSIAFQASPLCTNNWSKTFSLDGTAGSAILRNGNLYVTSLGTVEELVNGNINSEIVNFDHSNAGGMGHAYIQNNMSVGGSLAIGNSSNPQNITMFSPDGTAWTCGVADDGSWGCS